MSGDPRRVYYSEDSTPFVRGVPRVRGEATTLLGPCPHCGCITLFDLEVDVACDRLQGGCGMGFYVGCPACPFASPMMMIALGMITSEEKES